MEIIKDENGKVTFEANFEEGLAILDHLRELASILLQDHFDGGPMFGPIATENVVAYYKRIEVLAAEAIDELSEDGKKNYTIKMYLPWTDDGESYYERQK